MDEGERRVLMIFASAIGGSILSVWSLPWQSMSASARIFTFCASIGFGLFGAPWVASLMRISMDTLEAQCGVRFFGAAFGLVLLPALQAKAASFLNLKKEDEA